MRSLKWNQNRRKGGSWAVPGGDRPSEKAGDRAPAQEAISKAKPIRGIFKSANPGVGVFPPLFGPLVGGDHRNCRFEDSPDRLCFGNGLLGRSPVSGLLGRAVLPATAQLPKFTRSSHEVHTKFTRNSHEVHMKFTRSSPR